MAFWWKRSHQQDDREHDLDAELAPESDFTWEIETGNLPARYQMQPNAEPLVHLQPGPNRDYVVTSVGERLQPDDRQARDTATTSSRIGMGGYSTTILAGQRAAYVQYWLDNALVRWRQYQDLPSVPLLRDALLLLETGVDLVESHRLLILRAALMYRRGMVTALRHQHNPERTATVVADAALRPDAPLTQREITILRKADPDSRVWYPLMIRMLSDASLLTAEPFRSHAQRVLDMLVSTDEIAYIPQSESTEARRRVNGRLWFKLGIALLLMLAVWFVWSYVHWNGEQRLVAVPGGEYMISDSDGSGLVSTSVTKPFRMGKTEVTNWEYRECFESRACTWPKLTNSATRANYFVDTAFVDYPVVNISWIQADGYCRWLGGRLPLEDEWEIAAGAAIGTQRHFQYPWGDHFAQGVANSLLAHNGDTTAVGQYHPAGTSPLGVWDAAGNVAEWTATAGTPGGAAEGGDTFVIKGGSFRDEEELLRVGARRTMEADGTEDWLGFRCLLPGTGS